MKVCVYIVYTFRGREFINSWKVSFTALMEFKFCPIKKFSKSEKSGSQWELDLVSMKDEISTPIPVVLPRHLRNVLSDVILQ